MNDKEEYKVNLSGCDDSTIFNMELTADEALLLIRVSKKSKEMSDYGCMPTLDIKIVGGDNER